MKVVTVLDLRNSYLMLQAGISEGEEIRMEKHGQPIGLLTAWRRGEHTLPPKPDFAARRRAIWGSLRTISP
jgi:antitoxin (DNA-binding transcriptional repressor) of toxin-antitoxin stability system